MLNYLKINNKCYKVFDNLSAVASLISSRRQKSLKRSPFTVKWGILVKVDR